jgi:hypothetical protein
MQAPEAQKREVEKIKAESAGAIDQIRATKEAAAEGAAAGKDNRPADVLFRETHASDVATYFAQQNGGMKAMPPIEQKRAEQWFNSVYKMPEQKAQLDAFMRNTGVSAGVVYAHQSDFFKIAQGGDRKKQDEFAKQLIDEETKRRAVSPGASSMGTT